MKTIRQRTRRVVIGADDPTLTPAAGLMLVAEVDRVVGVVTTINDWVGHIKQRKQAEPAWVSRTLLTLETRMEHGINDRAAPVAAQVPP